MKKQELKAKLTRLDYQMFEAEKKLCFAQTKSEIKQCNGAISIIKKQIKEVLFQSEFCS